METGLVGELKDPDQFTRRYMIYYPYRDKSYLSLGMKVVKVINNIPDTTRFVGTINYINYGPIKIRRYRDNLNTMLINYYGPTKTFRTYPLADVLDDSEVDLRGDRDTDYMELFKVNGVYPKEVQISLINDSLKQALAWQAYAVGDTVLMDSLIRSESPFNDKIVLIGDALEEHFDLKTTPFYAYQGRERLMPGVETHAHAIQTILDNNYIDTPSRFQENWIILGLSLLSFLMLIILKPLLGAFFLILEVSGYSYLAYWLFIQKSLWISVVSPVAAVIFIFVINILYQFISEQKEKRKIRGMFSTYMSPKILKYLEDHPDAFSLKGEKREATMFFSDVANFTTISETLSAEELAIVLNKYLSPMTEILMSYDGYVDKYEGDAIMCDFGVPVPDPDHAWKACWAAIDQQMRLQEIRPKIKEEHGVDIYVRMGVNSGTVSAGNMGSTQRFQYTVMGDAVNQASRFEGANKQYNTYMMIGETTYELSKDKIEAHVLDKLVVKGKVIPITVYHLLGKKGDVEDYILEAANYFSQGITLYWDQNWKGAIEYFDKALSAYPEHAPSSVFIQRCQHFMKNPPPPDWKGEFIMTTK
jgi:adenylate cyclase